VAIKALLLHETGNEFGLETIDRHQIAFWLLCAKLRQFKAEHHQKKQTDAPKHWPHRDSGRWEMRGGKKVEAFQSRWVELDDNELYTPERLPYNIVSMGASQMALTLTFWVFYPDLAGRWHNICAYEEVFFTLPKRTRYGQRLQHPEP
jgi:hypothetical protein